tara:strand:+ start:555 stop:1259 length:705 start_codon:yes stop_codon:yes gene_type:complete
MKAIVLAAGLSRSLYPLTKNKHKGLLLINGKPLISHTVEKIQKVPNIEKIYIHTNEKFYKDYLQWKEDSGFDVEIVSNGIEGRRGSINELKFVVNKLGIKENLMVLAGEHLYDFSLRNFRDFFKENGSSIVAVCDYEDKNLIACRVGCVVLNGDKVVEFDEKPEEPKSSLASTACYILKKEDLALLDKFEKERLGDFVAFLVEHSNVRGYIIGKDKRWFPVSNVDQYNYLKNNY